MTQNAPITILSPDSGGDATGSGGSASATPSDDGGSGGDQTTDGSTGSGQIVPPEVRPGLAVDAPVTGNTPITILSPGSGGDATGPGTPPGPDTPTDPDGTPPTGPGPDSPPLGSPPGDGGDDDDPAAGGGPGGGPGSGGGGPGSGDPSRGRQGEFGENPGSSTGTELNELGAPGDLPFTGLLLWLVALIGVLFLAIGSRGRQLTAA